MRDYDPQISTLSEVERQQQFLRALWGNADALMQLTTMSAQGRGRASMTGLDIYRSNGFAIADRALSAAFPTVAQLLGDEGFATLCKHFWRESPPAIGDLGEYGAALPAFIAAQSAPALLSVPFLADIATLEWSVHSIERTIDPVMMDDSRWALLGATELDQVRVQLATGSQLVASLFPIVTIFEAHRLNDFSALQDADAFAGETAWVHREGYRGTVTRLAPAEAQFMSALRAGKSLSDALDCVADEGDFDFSFWLTRAAKGHWIADITVGDAMHTSPEPQVS